MEERLRFVARRLEGESMSDLCREFGISRKTGYKIYNRYKEQGLEALCDRSRRPVRYANQLPDQIEQMIVRLKREKPHWGARKIRELLVRRLAGDVRIPPGAPSMRCSTATASEKPVHEAPDAPEIEERNEFSGQYAPAREIQADAPATPDADDDDAAILAEVQAAIAAVMQELSEPEAAAQPGPAMPNPEDLAKGMLDYAAAQYPDWEPTDFHKITNAFAYGQRMGLYWRDICRVKAEPPVTEPPICNREFAEEMLAMVAERYPGMDIKDWQRVDRALCVARTRGIKWAALTAER